MTEPRLCSKCRLRPVKERQRWCGRCRNGRAPLDPNAAGRVHAPVNAVNGKPPTAPPPPAPLPPYRPFAGAVPEGLAPWSLVYLDTLAATGGEELAAQRAGVRRRQVTELAAARPDFADELHAAEDYFADVTAFGLIGSPRPVGSIVTLKARRPRQYLETVIANQINVQNTLNLATAPPPASVVLIMQTRVFSPEELAAMNGDVIDADVFPAGMITSPPA